MSLKHLIEEVRKYPCLWKKNPRNNTAIKTYRITPGRGFLDNWKKTSNFNFYCKMQALNLIGTFIHKLSIHKCFYSFTRFTTLLCHSTWPSSDIIYSMNEFLASGASNCT
jgi:hypothetical protein